MEVAARAQAGFPAGRAREEAEMRLTVRDGLATVFVAAAAAVYLLWVSGAAMTGWSVRVAAAVVFGLGWAACVTDQKQMAAVFGAARGVRRDLPRDFRTADLWLIHAADCRSRYSLRTCCGVRY